MSSAQDNPGSYSIRTQLNLLVFAASRCRCFWHSHTIFIMKLVPASRERKAEAQRLALVASADAHGYFARTEQRLGDISRRVEIGNLDPAAMQVVVRR